LEFACICEEGIELLALEVGLPLASKPGVVIRYSATGVLPIASDAVLPGGI
jgi:hypothetical protein